MELFVPVKPKYSIKTAATPLDDDPQRWTSQVLQELYRQVPEASEYTPKVVFFRQNPEQGFAFGAIVISAQTDSALNTPGGSSSTRAVVPVIIKNTELLPLDVIITQGGKYYPLNGVRLREALFRPNTFDMMTDDQNDGSLYSLFYPPGRTSNSPGSGTSTMGASGEVGHIYGPGFKLSSEDLLITEIAPTLSQYALDELSEKIAGEDYSPAFLGVLEALSRFDGQLMHGEDADALVKKATDLAPVHVAQFGYSHVDGYWMKKASRDLFAPERVLINRADLLKIAGNEVAMKVDTQGTVTVAEPAVDPEAMSQDGRTWAPVTEAGVYRVRDVTGQEYTGWVLPNLIDFNGTRLPLSAFTNGAVAATQDTIVGSKVSKDAVNLPEHPIKGTGVFYVVSANGVEATVPVKVLGAEAAMNGTDVYHVTTLLGDTHEVSIVPGVKALLAMDGAVMLPESARFLALDTEKPVSLMDDIGTAKMSSAPCSIQIRHDGIDPYLKFQGLPVLESYFGKNASYDDAVLVLCAAGLEPLEAHKTIKSAQVMRNTETVYVAKDVRGFDDFNAGPLKTASEKVQQAFSLRKDLTKEATVLPDIQTVDAVLSLGFINPENVQTFVSKLPYLEKALNSICELVLASRLGLSEISDSASARAARSLDETIQGLKGLALRPRDDGGSAA